MNIEKASFITAVGAFITSLIGSWDAAIITLIIFMAADWITGLTVAGVFKKSPKSETGALESRVGLKGLCRVQSSRSSVTRLCLFWKTSTSWA